MGVGWGHTSRYFQFKAEYLVKFNAPLIQCTYMYNQFYVTYLFILKKYNGFIVLAWFLFKQIKTSIKVTLHFVAATEV